MISPAYVDGLEQHIEELKSELRSHKAAIAGLQAERDALAAHVERLDDLSGRVLHECPNWPDSPQSVFLEMLAELRSEAPTTSLARLKAQAKAEAFENLANYNGSWTQADMRAIAGDYHRQANGEPQ
jgi:septal ring factor EnvC (AmiA/AmiB activator)